MNQPLSHHLLTMAYQNAWANHRLAKTWSQLSPAELAAPRVSCFPSLRATLNHILTCDWFYVDALERELRGDDPHPDCYVFFNQDEPFTQAVDLKREQALVDRRLIAYCEQMRDADLGKIVTIAGTRRNMRAAYVCSPICWSTRFIIEGRFTPCSAVPRSNRRNWTNFSVPASQA